MRRAVLFAAVVAVHLVLIRAWLRPRPPERPAAWRLCERLSEARRVTQKRELLEPEVLHLQPGSLAAPPGWRLAAADRNVVADLTADRPAPLRLQIDVPVEGGRDHVVHAMVRDPDRVARLLVRHTPTPEQPEAGWHRATDDRPAPPAQGSPAQGSPAQGSPAQGSPAQGSMARPAPAAAGAAAGAGAAAERVRFDWREDVPAGQRTLTLVLEAERASRVVLESVSVREASTRDPNLVVSGAAAALVGLVERPVEGAAAQSARGVRRLVQSLLASDGGAYEWTLPSPAPARLELETAVVPRGAPGGAPIDMSVEIERSGAWSTVYHEQRGAGGDGGGWKSARIALPRGATALRMSTRASGAGRPQVVAWGNPTLRDAAAPKRPHVLLVTLDAVRPDHLSAYGYRRATSPFLEKLAKLGARLEDVTAQRGHTWASSSSLATGLYPESSGVIARGARPHRGVRGMIDAFAAAGYRTGRIGSPDLPRGQIPGFDFAELADYDVDILSRLTAAAREHSDRPLFLWVHLANAHYPWRVADQFNRFDPGYSGPYASGLTRAEFRALEGQAEIPARVRDHLIALYDGSILQMDSRLESTFGELSRRGFFDDAVLAVTADHGTHMGEHDVWLLHSTPWHASLAVPLIVVAPGRVPAATVAGADRGRALLVDLGPTLLDLAGLPATGLDGMTLRPLFEGGRLPARTTVTRFQPAGYARVENDRYALIHNPSGEPLSWPGEHGRTIAMPRLALFDRLADPDEKHDLSIELPLVAGALAAEAAASADTAAPRLSSEARQLLMQAGYADE
jgi:arylsulfatase A-like enzyme